MICLVPDIEISPSKIAISTKDLVNHPELIQSIFDQANQKLERNYSLKAQATVKRLESKSQFIEAAGLTEIPEQDRRTLIQAGLAKYLMENQDKKFYAPSK